MWLTELLSPSFDLDADGDLVTGAASLDSEVSKDGGTFADCTNEATEIATSSGMYFLDLTSTEMDADTVAIIVKTGTAGAKTTPMVLYPEEVGDVRVDVVQISGDTAAADNLETMLDGTGTATLSLKQLSVINSTGDAIVASATGANGRGFACSGNGTGSGISSTGGNNAPGIQANGGAISGAGAQFAAASGAGILCTGGTNGHGVDFVGAGAGHGMNVGGGATGHGALFQGGPTSGDGLRASAVTSGNGITGLSLGGGGHGGAFTGQGAGHGLFGTGGSSNGTGIRGLGAGSAAGIEGQGAGAAGHGIRGAAGGSGSHGIRGEGSGTGHGASLLGGSSNGHGALFQGQGDGIGLRCLGGATGSGFVAAAGATSGFGMLVTATGDFSGLRCVGGNGGSMGHGLEGLSGTLGGDGIHGMAGGGSGGWGIRGVADPGRPTPSVSVGPPGTFVVNVFESIAVADRQLGGSAITGLPPRIIKNQDFNNFEFFMTDTADHVSAKTGLTITAQRSIDGGAFASCANSASEISNGLYKINLAASDVNGDLVTFRFTGTGADARVITITTSPA